VSFSSDQGRPDTHGAAALEAAIAAALAEDAVHLSAVRHVIDSRK
jgi:hypothetical protein